MTVRLTSALTDAGEDETGGTAEGGEVRLSVSRVTSCPEEFLIETFFAGTKAPALALSDVDRLAVAGVDGGEVTEGGGWGADV
jgi:hypothetical protein